MKATKNEVYMSFVRTLNVPEWSLPYLLGDTPWEELEDDDRVNLENFRASYEILSFSGSKFFTRSVAFGLACTVVPAQCIPACLVDLRSYAQGAGRIGQDNIVFPIYGGCKNYHAVSAAGFRLDGRMNLQSAAQTVYGHYKNALQNGTVAGFMIFSNGQLLLTTNEAFTHNFKVIVGRDPIQKLKGNRDTGFHLVPVSLQTACARPSRKALFA